MRRQLARRDRGQATVELAVAMVVLIPLTFYTLFLEDFNSYYLDWQEAITTSPWDFTSADYSKTMSADGAVAHNNRREFCDHTSAYTSFNADYECGNNKESHNTHHIALTAHQCWLVQNNNGWGSAKQAKQVTCTLDPSPGKLVDELFRYNHGGLGECTASLGVQNYFIIHSFLVGGSKHPDMVATKGHAHGLFHDKDYTGGGNDIHSNSAMGYGWIIGAEGTSAETHYGMIVDPWAVNTTNDQDPDSSSGDDFKKRVDAYFGAFGAIPGALADTFGAQLVGAQLIGPQAVIDGKFGDQVLTDTLAWKKDYKREVNGHYASGYNDCQESDYKSRVDGYLSKEDSTW